MNFKKLGLCLSGGGGKGAYQIGVWRALRDYGLESSIAAVAGTSVGGLNGAMVAQSRYEKAEAMWLNIESRNMLTVQDSPQIAAQLIKFGATGTISPAMLLAIQNKGLFKPDGLKAMIADGLDGELLVNSPVPLTVALHHHNQNQVKYFPIRSVDIAADALQATAALPFIFEPVEIGGSTYTDGGFYWGLPQRRVDNTPISPLVEAGCDTIIVVCLSQDDLTASPRQHSGVRILPLVPNRSLGGALSPLDFSNKGAADRMEQGYADACYLLSHLELFLANETQYTALWERAHVGAEVEPALRIALNQNDTRHSDNVNAVRDFDRIIANDDFKAPLGLADSGDEASAFETLTLENSACLSAIERQQIEVCVDKFLVDNQNNRKALEAAALDALSALSPVTGHANHLQEQGVALRLWGAITGNNQKLSAENDHALAQAQFASLRLIAAVQEKGAITLEFAVALQNRINGAYKEIGDLGQRHNQDLRRVYRSMAGAYTRLRDKLINHETRLNQLEQRTKVHDWLLHPNRHRIGTQSLQQLPVPLRLAALANDFYNLTEGKWSIRELQSLKEMCALVDMAETKPVSVIDFYQALLTQPQVTQTLTAQLAYLAPSAKDAAPPRLNTAHSWLLNLRANTLPASETTESALAQWGYAPHTQLPAWDFLVDLLYQFQSAGLVPVRHSDLSDLKAKWKDQLAHLSTLVGEKILPAAFAIEVRSLQDNIESFRLTVPLIGKFSAGKSTLLNCWMQHDFQPDALEPCTSVATEFHYAAPGDEHYTVHRLIDPNTGQTQSQTFPLEGYAKFVADLGVSGGSTSENPPVFVEVHAHRPQLAQHPDLILVDTPGLESTRGEHEKALARYIGDGVAFILCATPKSQIGQGELAFVERLRALGQTYSLLVCQEHLGNSSERENNRRNMAEAAGVSPDQLVRGCSAKEGELSGLEDILLHLEKQKALLFGKQFAPKVRALMTRAESLLREQLAADTQVNVLHDKKTAIGQSSTRLEATLCEEESQLLRDCNGTVLRQINSTISSFLRARQRAYVQQLLGGQDCGALIAADAQNAFQLAANQHLVPRLKEAGQRVGRSANLQTLGNVNLSAAVVGAVEGQGKGGALGGAAAGAALGSIFPGVGTAIGAVLGGFAGYFMGNSNKESEANSKVAQAISATLDQLETAVPGALQQHCQSYLKELRTAVEQQLVTESQHLAQLETQIAADGERRQEIRNKAQVALDKVELLLSLDESSPAH